MKFTKDQMRKIIETAGYRVFDDTQRLTVHTRADEYVVTIPYDDPDKEFWSPFVESIIND